MTKQGNPGHQRTQTCHERGVKPSQYHSHSVRVLVSCFLPPACQGDKRVPQSVVVDTLLGAEGEHETVVVLVGRGRSANVMFAHVVPQKGFAHEFG